MREIIKRGGKFYREVQLSELERDELERLIVGEPPLEDHAPKIDTGRRYIRDPEKKAPSVMFDEQCFRETLTDEEKQQPRGYVCKCKKCSFSAY